MKNVKLSWSLSTLLFLRVKEILNKAFDSGVACCLSEEEQKTCNELVDSIGDLSEAIIFSIRSDDYGVASLHHEIAKQNWSTVKEILSQYE